MQKFMTSFLTGDVHCSVAMRKVAKRRCSLFATGHPTCYRPPQYVYRPPQATGITGHSPASSCSWGKGCPSPLLVPPSPKDTAADLTVSDAESVLLSDHFPSAPTLRRKRKSAHSTKRKDSLLSAKDSAGITVSYAPPQ